VTDEPMRSGYGPEAELELIRLYGVPDFPDLMSQRAAIIETIALGDEDSDLYHVALSLASVEEVAEAMRMRVEHDWLPDEAEAD
jgi:hypothetical protein